MPTYRWNEETDELEQVQPHELRALRVSEVSLVDRGANPYAKVVIAKRDGAAVQKGKTMLKKKDIFAAADAGNVRKSGLTRDQVADCLDRQIRKSGPGYVLSPEGLRLTQIYNELPAAALPPARVQKAAEMGGAEATLEAGAIAIAKRDGIPFEQAYLRECEAHPELYKAAQNAIMDQQKDDPGTLTLAEFNACAFCGAQRPGKDLSGKCANCGREFHATQTAA